MCVGTHLLSLYGMFVESPGPGTHRYFIMCTCRISGSPLFRNILSGRMVL